MNEKNMKMLKILADNAIFKLDMIWEDNAEFKLLFKEYTLVEVTTFVRKMFKKYIFKSDYSFSPNKHKKEQHISFWIDWDMVIEDVLFEETMVKKLKRDYPRTYALTIAKAKFMMELDFVKFVEPAKVVNVYDNILLLGLKQGQYRILQEEKDKIVDCYCNLQVILEQIPLLCDMYHINAYEDILKELNLEIPAEFKQELEDLAAKSVKKLYTLAETLQEENT